MKQLHRRVVVTGLGILSPIGNTVDEAWYSCIEGKSGIAAVDIGLENILKQIPVNKMGNPQDIADLALFLASSKADYITGQTISVDGGLYMN